MRYSYKKKIAKQKNPIIIYASYIFVFAGTLILLWSFYPIILFQAGEFLANSNSLSPVPKSVLASSLKKGLSVYDEDLAPYYSSYLRDFTRVGEWFPQSPQSITNRKNIKEYIMSIPKINVVDAKVTVGGEDLKKSLVQYGDTVYPGELGNTVVLGHSTLPQLYKQGDYKSIWTFLPSMEKGDEITIKINGFTYTYVVYEMFVVDPSDTWVLDSQAEESILTLITCVPPGTYWKRLIVKAKLKYL